MNHTALLGLEVYLLYAALQELRPGTPRPRTTVWPPFLDMPLLGSFYRAGGCVPMSVAGVSAVLRGGQSVLILPEGPDATDVRDELAPFHSGFLRVVKRLADEDGMQVPIVPLGWSGVDEANPWWVVTRPLVVRALMKPFMPRFDFALLPRPPLLRPSKVVFVAGEPITVAPGALGDEAGVRRTASAARRQVLALMQEATAIRDASIAASPFERVLHSLTGSRRVRWERRPLRPD
jgi:1-acyl-sn-glycerol-3-phosphate acyltransferase